MNGPSEDALNDLCSLSTRRPWNNNVQVNMVLYMQRQRHQNPITGKLPMLPKNDD